MYYNFENEISHCAHYWKLPTETISLYLDTWVMSAGSPQSEENENYHKIYLPVTETLARHGFKDEYLYSENGIYNRNMM